MKKEEIKKERKEKERKKKNRDDNKNSITLCFYSSKG